MIEVKDRIDEIHDRVMAGLKDFQQATVERASAIKDIFQEYV